MQKRSLARSPISLGLLSLVAAGCLSSPRNNQSLGAKNSTVKFEGYFNEPSSTMKFSVQNFITNTWDPLATAVTSSTVTYTDSQGDNWYYFANDSVTLPQDGTHWKQKSTTEGARTMIAQVEGNSDAFTHLITYDYGTATDTCVQNNEPSGGAAIMGNCASSQSPVVTLIAPCGKSGAVCCIGGAVCDFGDNCVSGSPNNTCSQACGTTGKPCCGDAQTCVAGEVCTGIECEPCGAEGERCCTGNKCNSSGDACNGVSCQPCGAGGEQCCAGSKCNSGNACAGGSCSACGGNNEQCCAGNTCTNGNTCSNGNCGVPSTCGAGGTTCSASVHCCAGLSCLQNSNGVLQCCTGFGTSGQCLY